ncbi:hypothetical protein, partial [Escherichia coli]|uniref:hypothetical protein n=1 Tax=Escherichia coli TaxID=562 RepID=UPI0032DBA976
AQEQGPTPMDWDTAQTFHRQLHDEQMNYWREQRTWQEGQFTSVFARQDRQDEQFLAFQVSQNEELLRMRRATEENARIIQDLQARFDSQFHPPSFGDQ